MKMVEIWHFYKLFNFYPILDYYKIRTKRNFDKPNSKSLDLQLMWSIQKKLFPG